MRRKRISEALDRVNAPTARRMRFRCCGCDGFVERSPSTGRVRYRACFCHDRFCDPCARARARDIRRNLVALIGEQTVRFVTLTLKASDAPLSSCLDRLYRCFRNLRQSRVWKESVTGAASFCEVKLGSGSGRWHVHLHLICAGGWIDQRKLSDAWFKVTGDSFRVDVRAVRDREKVGGYVTKYVTKGFDKSVEENAAALDECIVSLRGRRLCLTVGRWRGTELEADSEGVTDWEPLGRLGSIYNRARGGELVAQVVIAMLQGGSAGDLEEASALLRRLEAAASGCGPPPE